MGNQTTALPHMILWNQPTPSSRATRLLDTLNLAHIPEEILHTYFLEFLSLYGNQLTYVSPDIGNLDKLTYLNLTSNHLTCLPKEIGKLAALGMLRVERNHLTHLPKEIGYLTNLESLLVGYNRLTHLPKEVGNLAKLTFIGLSSNQMVELPPEFGTLTNLKVLYLGHNRMTCLPREIGNLTNLTHINIDYNRLTHLPREIGHLQCLTHLNLFCNLLTYLPKEMGNLKNLEFLHLGQNDDIIYPPHSMCADTEQTPQYNAQRIVKYFQKHDDTISVWGRYNVMWKSIALLFLAKRDTENCAHTFARLPEEMILMIQEYVLSDPYVPIPKRVIKKEGILFKTFDWYAALDFILVYVCVTFYWVLMVREWTQ